MSNQWISTKNRYPEKEDCYLVNYIFEGENHTALLYYRHDEKFAGVSNITHWMTIPKLPKNK